MASRISIASSILALAFATSVVSTAVAQTDDWAKVVEAAKKEGEVIVWGQAGETNRRFWKDAFERDNPGIRVNLFQPNNTAERDTRVLREWQAKLLKVDLFVAGSAGMIARLKPANIIQPIRPFLRADILDGKNWLNGEPVWVDTDKKYVIVSDLPVGSPVILNPSVDRNSVRTWKDLLDPKWNGKIVSLDPRQSGQGYAYSLVMYTNKDLGPNFVREFFKGGRIVFSSDQRQIAEWVDSGRMQIGFALREPEIRQILDLGSKIQVVSSLEAGGVQQSLVIGSDGTMGIANLDPLPNPNATRVYANWFYSQRGQQAMVDATGLFSTRVDVDTSKLPERVRQQPGVKYTNANDEALIRPEVTKAMRDLVAATLADK
jgi:iron(III) transport system substrate-binding protein